MIIAFIESQRTLGCSALFSYRVVKHCWLSMHNFEALHVYCCTFCKYLTSFCHAHLANTFICMWFVIIIYIDLGTLFERPLHDCVRELRLRLGRHLLVRPHTSNARNGMKFLPCLVSLFGSIAVDADVEIDVAVSASAGCGSRALVRRSLALYLFSSLARSRTPTTWRARRGLRFCLEYAK